MIKKIFAILAIIILFCSCSGVPSSSVAPCCHMRLRVLDGMTDAPISGAEVVVPETGDRFITDENGSTVEMELPILPDTEYDKLLPSSEGRITFIVYAEGYVPLLLLYVRTRQNRRTIDALMFNDDGTLPVFTIIEAPPAEWSRELIEKYR